jgi:hypothetical protein
MSLLEVKYKGDDDPDSNDLISIRECQSQQDIDLFIQVNANARGWPIDHPVYVQLRENIKQRLKSKYFMLFYDDIDETDM